MNTYPHTINSLRTQNPDIPNILGDVLGEGDIRLDEEVAQGQPLDRQHVRRARLVADTLRNMRVQALNPGILTQDVVESAKRRADVLNLVHAQSEYMPADVHAEMQALRAEFRAEVRVLRAEAANNTIRLRNRFDTGNQPLSPVQKTVPGSGLQRASDLAPNDASVAAITQFAAVHPEFTGADIGTTPPNFDPIVFNYQHINILHLILFYNEDLGVVPGSGAGERRLAVYNWLKTL